MLSSATASVVGGHQHQVNQRSFVKQICGQKIDGTHVSAIQLSAAAGLAAVLGTFAKSGLEPGFVKAGRHVP